MSENSPILLFDGECKFCNFWISFIKKRKANTQFSYFPLHSAEGEKLIEYHRVNKSLDSVIVIKNNMVYTKSSAALAIVNELGGWWKLLKISYLIPKSIRDSIYDLVARNRHKLFKANNCELH